MTTINVKKHNGTFEPLNLEKIHKVVEYAARNLEKVSASQIEINANLQFYDGITTSDIQRVLIRSASDLISLEAPNYQYAASRLLLYSLRKNVFNWKFDSSPPTIKKHISNCVKINVYERMTLDSYTDEEFKEVDTYLDHTRDYNFTYAGLRQIIDKYLVQNRKTKKIYETPQYMYMMIALTLFASYDDEKRLKYVKNYYDAISLHKINLPTPILAGVRTKLRNYASCVLVDVGDSLDSIFASNTAVGKYTASRSGIGLNFSRIRSINSSIGDGNVQHTGIIPFLKVFESTVKSCHQNSLRGGSLTSHLNIWHKEIMDYIVLKNNKGIESNRVRGIDLCVKISRIFYERFINDQEITLFNPNQVQELEECYGTHQFDYLYDYYEKNIDKLKIDYSKVKAREVFFEILKERNQTGRVYIMNIDHCNYHSSFIDRIHMSNLCQEITLPTTPINDKTEEGEIALCILSAINLSKIKNLKEIEKIADLAVRALDSLISYQDYLFPEAKKSAVDRRPLGIGFIGLAHYLAKNGVKYSDNSALEIVHKVSEYLQFYCLKASNQLAKEMGKCKLYYKTKYSRGVLPIDSYKKEIDEYANFKLELPWEELRRDIDVYGVRNSTLTAQMPSESSSVTASTTNGVEPVRGHLQVKKSKKGVLRLIVPDYDKLKNKYEIVWDIKDNDGYLKIISVIQKFFDQSISANTYYNPEHYDDNEIPISILVKDVINAYKYGLKTLYYQNTFDGKEDNDKGLDDLLKRIIEVESNIDDCGVCSI